MVLFFCTSAACARSIPLEAQNFTIAAESVERALLQAVEQSGHQLILQGRSKLPNRSYDYTGIDTLPGILSRLLFKSGLEYEILANNIILIDAEKQINSNVVTLSDSEKTIKDTFSWLQEIMISVRQEGSDALDVSLNFRVRSEPAVDTKALFANEDIRSLTLNLLFFQTRGAAQSSLEAEGMQANIQLVIYMIASNK